MTTCSSHHNHYNISCALMGHISFIMYSTEAKCRCDSPQVNITPQPPP